MSKFDMEKTEYHAELKDMQQSAGLNVSFVTFNDPARATSLIQAVVRAFSSSFLCNW